MKAAHQVQKSVPQTRYCSRTQSSPRTCIQFVSQKEDDVSARFQEMSEYREHDHSQIMKLPLVRREPPVDAVVPGVCTNKGPQRGLHAGASIAGSSRRGGSHALVISTCHGTEHR